MAKRLQTHRNRLIKLLILEGEFKKFYKKQIFSVEVLILSVPETAHRFRKSDCIYILLV